MAFSVKPKKNATSAAITAAQNSLNTAQNQTGTTTGTSNSLLTPKAYAAAPFDNSSLGLKDANGKLLPPQITVGQAEKALQDTKNNGAVIESVKTQIASSLPSVMTDAGVTSLSPSGSLTPKEFTAIHNVLNIGYQNEQTGKALNFSNIVSNFASGAYSAGSQNISSTINSKSLDQPNIEASKATINSIFSDMLGRTATDSEINKYTTQYLQYAAQNPINNTTGSYNYGYIGTPSGGSRLMRQSTNETSTQNNLNEKDYITNQVLGSADYNTFAAANTAYGFLQNLAKQSAGTE
jgi:hypothetical protein